MLIRCGIYLCSVSSENPGSTSASVRLKLMRGAMDSCGHRTIIAAETADAYREHRYVDRSESSLCRSSFFVSQATKAPSVPLIRLGVKSSCSPRFLTLMGRIYAQRTIPCQSVLILPSSASMCIPVGVDTLNADIVVMV